MRKPCYDGDRCLKLLPMFLDATSLNLYSVRRPSTEYLLQMTSLRSLCLGRTREITNHCLSQLTALTNLDLTANEYITDAGLITLNNLKILDLHANQIITTNCILKLTSLTALNLCWSNISVYRVVKEMTSLRHLSIQKYQHDPHWVTRHSLKIQVLPGLIYFMINVYSICDTNAIQILAPRATIVLEYAMAFVRAIDHDQICLSYKLCLLAHLAQIVDQANIAVLSID